MELVPTTVRGPAGPLRRLPITAFHGHLALLLGLIFFFDMGDTAFVADRSDRKWLIMIVAAIIAACGMLYGLSFRAGLIVVFGFLVEMFLHTFASLLHTYTAESFPTAIRNSGTGLAYGAGRLANVFGPWSLRFSSTASVTQACLLTSPLVGCYWPLLSTRLVAGAGRWREYTECPQRPFRASAQI